ncbi:MAG: DUF664 domain-containing protein [Kineosporiaceae bacterium]|nr:DUF664 domain-containing protein [Kineosporiaceae bacterium]MBK7624808.1 DUF664 domain-containing protein [Kineosporiaceae bacterium]MBK8076815.1 DUF664 domain-containing protein [Kineosporiaceae bacterium]
MTEAHLTAGTEPRPDDVIGADRWVAYLDWLRSEIVTAVLSLPDEEQRRSRLDSGWTPLQLLSHVLHMEQRWFVWGFLGEPVEQPYGDWNVAEPWVTETDQTLPGARWQVPDDVTAAQLAQQWDAVAARTRSVIRRHGPNTPAALGGRFATAPTPTLEWILLHVLAEYARHAGHLDIVVELTPTNGVDG